MSDLMFNETPVVGKKYSFGDWKLYAVHNDKEIKGFFGEYRWLSNFEKAWVSYGGHHYPSSEQAYQAAKVHPDERVALIHCTPAESKKVWKTLTRMDESAKDWDARKYDVMAEILFSKFLFNKELRQKLLDTGDRYLEETNHWKDTYWGVDINLGGQNNLGKILMKIREFWK